MARMGTPSYIRVLVYPNRDRWAVAVLEGAHRGALPTLVRTLYVEYLDESAQDLPTAVHAAIRALSGQFPAPHDAP